MNVSLVIPGRNTVSTLPACLEAVVPLIASGALAEIVFVDDGSTDETREVASRYPVRCVEGRGGGPGYARNLGWRSVETPLVWFIDSDCVAEPDALELLLSHLDGPKVVGVGGSYGNMRPDSLLACLIHQEILVRHHRMKSEVDYLGSFNVLYRRAALQEVDGFDEHLFNGPGSPGAEDIELAYRLRDRGYVLRFDRRSRVGHFHPSRLRRYLRAQAAHGFWRVQLYARHRGKAAGDSYSDLADHLQPPLAALAVVSLPTLYWPATRWLAATVVVLLALLQLPMTTRLIARTRDLRYAAFGPMGMTRAFARAYGMVRGLAAALARAGLRQGGGS